MVERITKEELEELRWHADRYEKEQKIINEPELGSSLPLKMLSKLLNEIDLLQKREIVRRATAVELAETLDELM